MAHRLHIPAVAALAMTGALLAQEPPREQAQEPTRERPRPGPEMKKFAREFGEKMGRGEGKLVAGDPAPDFQLKRLHSEDSVRLSRFHGVRPVALIFGSYT